jgi:hypothetical protein
MGDKGIKGERGDDGLPGKDVAILWKLNLCFV